MITLQKGECSHLCSSPAPDTEFVVLFSGQHKAVHEEAQCSKGFAEARGNVV